MATVYYINCINIVNMASVYEIVNKVKENSVKNFILLLKKFSLFCQTSLQQ